MGRWRMAARRSARAPRKAKPSWCCLDTRRVALERSAHLLVHVVSRPTRKAAEADLRRLGSAPRRTGERCERHDTRVKRDGRSARYRGRRRGLGAGVGVMVGECCCAHLHTYSHLRPPRFLRGPTGARAACSRARTSGIWRRLTPTHAASHSGAMSEHHAELQRVCARYLYLIALTRDS
jgi:hypothetical protein